MIARGKQKRMCFWSEFRSFAVKCNAFDLAVAVILGNAFSAIVNSLVGDIITPLLGLVTGGTTDVKDLTLTLNRPYPLPGGTAQPLLLHYGSFIQTVLNFFLIALSIFFIFKLMTTARQRVFKEVVPAAEKPAQERLLEEIRDLLKEKK